MATAYDELLKLFKKREEGARLSNLSRKDQVEKIYSDIIKRYEPGGAFGAGYESQIQRQKVRDVGATSQRDISRGLYGIRPYEQEWEATTGASARLKLEDIRMERLSGAQTSMAGFLTDIDEPYPDYSSLLAASQAQGQQSGGSTTSKLAEARASNPFMRSLLGGSGGGGGSAYSPITRTGGTSGPYGGGTAISGGQGLVDPSQIIGGSSPTTTTTPSAPADATGGTQPNPAAISKFAGINKWSVGYQKFDNYADALEASKKYSKA